MSVLPRRDVGKGECRESGGIRVHGRSPLCPRKELFLSGPSEPELGDSRQQAAEHLTGVHLLLKDLQDKIGEHPLLAEAIVKVELALNTLGVKTAGML
jgi:hypothetical protein